VVRALLEDSRIFTVQLADGLIHPGRTEPGREARIWKGIVDVYGETVSLPYHVVSVSEDESDPVSAAQKAMAVFMKAITV
jgi:hypothetical protein